MHLTFRKRRRAVAALAAAALAAPLLLTAAATPAAATPDPAKKGRQLAKKLVKRTNSEGTMRHLRVFQAIADFTDDNRAAGAAGHELSARYAGTLLRARS